MILSDPRQHKFASCTRRETALGCLWSLAEGLGFCGTVDSGMPVPCVQCAADSGTRAPGLLLTLLKFLSFFSLVYYFGQPTGFYYKSHGTLYFPPHLLICTHPKSCQPVGLLQWFRVCTPALGEGGSSWEMSAMLGLVSGPTSSHSGGQSIPW